MEIAVFSDIHGNHVAFQKCLDYARERNIDTFFFLGDYLGELAYPQKTMKMIYEMKEKYSCHFVKGNKEDYWLNYRRNGECGWKTKDSTTGALLYTYSNLTPKDMGFFENMPLMQRVAIPNLPQITICHGSPRRVNEKMLPDCENTFRLMEQDNSSLIICGHTHVQKKICYQGKTVLDAGSIGVSLQSPGKARFLILHGTKSGWEEEFIGLDYDVERTVLELQESGLDEMAPCWCKVSKHLLPTGTVSHGSVLAKAMELCEKAEGECIWPNIPEKYWEMAVEIMLP